MSAVVLSAFADHGVVWSVLWRPLAVTIIATAIVQIALTVATRSPHLAAFASVLLGTSLLSTFLVALAVVLAFDLWLIARLVSTRRVSAIPWPAISQLGNAIATVLFLLTAVSVLLAVPYAPPRQGPRPVAQGALPDVYLILLDGHPRLDTIRDHFGVDTSSFVTFMTEHGFVESARAHSNYNMTFLTLASFFGGAQVHDLVPPAADPVVRERLVDTIINEGRGLATFREAGYEIISLASSFTQVSMQAADRFLDSGNINHFEIGLIRAGLLKFVLSDVQRAWLMEDHRDRVRWAFRTLEELARETVNHPRLIYAHVMSPHAPIAFDAAGGPVEGLDCMPVKCDLWAFGQDYPEGRTARQAGQISYIDSQVERVVEVVEEGRRPAVVVFFSDHGHRYEVSDKSESLHSFLFAKTPGHSSVFPETATPVNILSRISNAYLGTNLPYSTEESYFLDISRIEEQGVFSYEPATLDP